MAESSWLTDSVGLRWSETSDLSETTYVGVAPRTPSNRADIARVESVTLQTTRHISASFYMELFTNAADDQIALMGCAAALLFSGGLMYISFFVSRHGQNEETTSRSIPLAPVQKTDSDSSERKAA